MKNDLTLAFNKVSDNGCTYCFKVYFEDEHCTRKNENENEYELTFNDDNIDYLIKALQDLKTR